MKKFIAFLMSVLLACSAAAPSIAEANAYPVTIIDHAGRSVSIHSRPKSIVSGYYIATSMLIGLGLQNQLVGVENNADLRPIYRLSAPNVLSLPGLGTVKVFDLEACAALNPDLVVLPLKLKDAAATLETLGFTCIVINPESRRLMEESIRMLGMATGCTDRAESMLDAINEHIASLSSALTGAEKPSVYFAGNSSFLKTAGPAMYQHSLLENAAAENAAASIADTYWAEISYEQLLAWDPDTIILAADSKAGIEDVLADPVLADCRAVQGESVFRIPNHIESWDSPVPASFLGSLYIASCLHPDLYPRENYAAAAVDFYETFYGFTPDIH